SGKSTTTLTLFRLLEIESGSITVDGVPISEVQLFQLRSKLAIIPQDPVLFTGTIRSNLDPFNDFQEERLWEVLRATDLEGFVRSQAMGLDREVTEGARIVVLDEATSAIDVTTDAMVQRVVAEHFKDCTLLIIAHRLETIMACDYIAGLAQGTTEEFGPPATLLGFDSGDCDRFLEAAANVSPEENGLLAKLVAQTGQASAKHLTAMALLSRGLKRRKKQSTAASGGTWSEVTVGDNEESR
ncbi:Abcc5, partial [Symbiodinium sp. KB8]